MASGRERSCGEQGCAEPALSCGAGATVRPMTSFNTRWNGPSSTRAQWGVNDIPLYELERAWNQPGPGAPLPVTLGDGRPALARTLRTVADVHAAIEHYVRCIPYDQVLSTAQHISTDVNLRLVTEAEMAAALARSRSRCAGRPGCLRQLHPGSLPDGARTARRPDRLPVLHRRGAAAL